MIISKLPGRTRQAASLISAALLAVMVSPATRGAAAVANPRAGDRPVPLGRVWASWAYDPAGRDVVLFGGDTGYQRGPDTVFARTWTWNGVAWTRQNPAVHPSPRTGAAMVWDAATRQLLLFGGSRLPFSGGGYLAGTWAWNGTAWTQLHPATSPPPRDTHSMVYDPATRTTILFGGFNGVRLSDTWSWDGVTWTQLHPATSPGVVSTAWQAAYDGASHQLVLFGGDPGLGTFTNDTWTWNGTTWTELHPAVSPAPRAYGSLTFDQALHRLVLFAGSTGNADPATAWEWNGSTWRA